MFIRVKENFGEGNLKLFLHPMRTTLDVTRVM